MSGNARENGYATRSCRWVGLSAPQSRQEQRHTPPIRLLDCAAAMEAGDSIHNVFSSDRLWEQSSFFDVKEESSLFTPLQLDSEPSRP